MRRFLFVFAFGFLALCAVFAVVHAQSSAEGSDVIARLLEMPAPQPPFIKVNADSKSENTGIRVLEEMPSDDAPIEELIKYWQIVATINGSRDASKPSAVTKKRLLEACEEDPEKLGGLVSVLSDDAETAERVKKIFDAQDEENKSDAVRKWLRTNSKAYSDELLNAVRKVKDKDGYVDKKDDLKALAKVDWEKAKPVLENLLSGNQPRANALALSLLYQNAVKEKDNESAEKYRERLRAIVEDKNAPGSARDEAADALFLNGDWDGRDEWYLTLMEDETLLSPSDGVVGFSPLTTLFNQDAKKWIPVMIKLLESKNKVVHNNAGNILVQHANDEPSREVILPLLPWLSNPDWLDVNGTNRSWFIQQMDEIEIPESVPGLIWIIENEDDERGYAAAMMAKYKDPRAIPALKKALTLETYENDQMSILKALIACGGLTAQEMTEALEEYATKSLTEEGRAELERYRSSDDKPLSVNLLIGKYLSSQKDVPEDLVLKVQERIKELQKGKPEVAKFLLEISQRWEGRFVDLDMVRRIGNGKADAETVVNALKRSDKLRESVLSELYTLVGMNGTPNGIGAVLLNDEMAMTDILGEEDKDAQRALLACARLTAMPLPIKYVEALLKNKDKNLSLAAESYLKAEDSAEARRLVYEKHPDEAIILGWSGSYYSSTDSSIEKVEEKLRKEILEENGVDEIYASLNSYGGGSQFIRVRKGKAVLTINDSSFRTNISRYKERSLSDKELESLRNYMAANNMNDTGPVFTSCHHNCWQRQFVNVTGKGGRRIFMVTGFEVPEPIAGLEKLFNSFATSGEFKLHYLAEKEINGFEVLFMDDSSSAQAVWKEGNDLRLLIEKEIVEEADNSIKKSDDDDDEETEESKRKKKLQEIEKERAKFSWHSFSNNRLGNIVNKPSAYSSDDKDVFVDWEDFKWHLNERMRYAKAGDYIIAADGGLWKARRNQKPVNITNDDEGSYATPIVTPDGKWAIASKTDDDWGSPNYMVRVNLQTGRAFRVDVPVADNFWAVMFIQAHKKVLLYRAKDDSDYDDNVGPDEPEYYLMDAATGKTEIVKGEFRPLKQTDERDLQPTGKPDEFWAAISDKEKNQTKLGKYNIKKFSFEPVITLPKLEFNSTDMWVDEKEGKVYLIFDGHLIRFSLTQKASA